MPQYGRPTALVDEARRSLREHFGNRPREVSASPYYDRIFKNLTRIEKLRKKGVTFREIVNDIFPRSPRPTTSYFRKLYIVAQSDPGENVPVVEIARSAKKR